MIWFEQLAAQNDSRGAVVGGIPLPHHVSIRHDDVNTKASDSLGYADLVECQQLCSLASLLQCACSAHSKPSLPQSPTHHE